MKAVSENIISRCGYSGVKGFLIDCQRIAQTKGRTQIGSVSFEIQGLDLLIPNLDFYFEHPENDFAIAASGKVVEGVFAGKERFKRVHNFSKEILKDTIIMGSVEKFIRPQFITSFTFCDTEVGVRGSDFPAAWVFLPALQLVRSRSRFFLMVNIMIDLEVDIEFLAKEVWEVYLKFKALDNGKVLEEKTAKDKAITLEAVEVPGVNWYEKAVGKAIEGIEAGEFEKIVIARTVDFIAKENFDVLGILDRLRRVYPCCRTCLIANGKGQSFICATPEQLLKVENQGVITEALAGTILRGATEVEDEALGKALLGSVKDLDEHQYVVDSIVERLASLGIKAEFDKKPQLKKLANVQHLCTPIEGTLPKGVHLLELAESLHPTPAVCGTPREAAKQAIAKLEPFDRGLYAGVLGFFDSQGNGEFVVGIRSALIDGCKARLYAGGGIVKGSKVGNERRETDIKLQAMLRNLL